MMLSVLESRESIIPAIGTSFNRIRRYSPNLPSDERSRAGRTRSDVKGADVPIILRAKRHDNSARGEIDDLNAHEYHVANHCRMQEE